MGRVSDFTVIKWRRMRKGVWYPEDRLRAAVIPFAVLLPLSVLGFGLVNKFVGGNVGLMLSLVCLFFCGGGVSGQTNVAYQILQKTNINDLYQGKYDFCGLRCVSGRCIAVPKFRNLGSNEVRTFLFIQMFII